jgi:CubicO group peptidase (beta-lactamase class C family)
MKSPTCLLPRSFSPFIVSFLIVAQACGTFPGRWGRIHPGGRGGLDRAAYPKIEAICRKIVEERHASGVVLLIGRRDRVLFRKAFGYRMNDPKAEPMTVDTLFDLASLTKPTCTASAIMLLVQDGRVALDTPVARYVPEFDREDKRDITIRHLLTHTSGLPAYTSAALVEKEYGPRPNPDGLIRHIATLPKKYPTGKGSIYSCLNYLVLARVAQNVTGANPAVFLRERLWQPLGMKDTTFYPTAEQIARTAPTIHDGETFRRGEVHDPLAYYSVNESYAPGNAGGFSTVDDMARLVRMLLDGGRRGRARIFQPLIWEKIMTEQTGSLRAGRTCGWEQATSNAYCTPLNKTPETCCLIHTGYTGTLIWMDKLSKTYVIFFSNCVYPTDEKKHKDAVIQARRQIIRTVLDHLDIYRATPSG